MSLLEFKRRLAWLWRLALSEPVRECDGATSALWVFDTIAQPDGAVLRPHVRSIAMRESLNLISFGPRKVTATRLLRALQEIVPRMPLLAARDFDAAFSRQVFQSVERCLGHSRPQIVIVGAMHGTFARALHQLDPAQDIWEVQHGLLDRSYFPMQAQRFYARSPHSASIVRAASPQVAVEMFSDCLAHPEGRVALLQSLAVKHLACYSKNAGGGCNTAELVEFERSCRSLATKLGLQFSLHLHPRDNIWKLVRRHRSLRPLLWAATAQRDQSYSRLVVSAYSSALVSNSRAGDALLNVEIGKPDEIVLKEYGWLPTIHLRALAIVSGKDHVFLRTK